jgi:DNA-binding MarR family transcriptional regulator
MPKATAHADVRVSPPTQAVIELMRAADRTRRALVRVLNPYDLTLQQMNVLIILRHAGGQGLPTLEVAKRLVEQTPGITRLMNTLASKNYIRRHRHKDDRRQQLCYLTDKGTRLIDSVLPAILASHARSTGCFDIADLETLITLLSKVNVPPGA